MIVYGSLAGQQVTQRTQRRKMQCIMQFLKVVQVPVVHEETSDTVMMMLTASVGV